MPEAVTQPHRRSLLRDLLVRRRRASKSHTLTEVDHAKDYAHSGERHNTSTSGDSAEPCHSADEHLSNDQATPPDRDPSEANVPSASSQGPASPLPVGSRAEVPPQTESDEQQAYATRTSQRVWNSAYDSLKNDGNTATLVESYVRTLNKVLGTENDTANGVAAGLDDPDTRQCVMKKFVEAGQAKIATSSRLTKGVGNVAEFIQKIKPIVDTAIGNIPQAALPWAGVCVGLQVRENFCVDWLQLMCFYLDPLKPYKGDELQRCWHYPRRVKDGVVLRFDCASLGRQRQDR